MFLSSRIPDQTYQMTGETGSIPMGAQIGKIKRISLVERLIEDQKGTPVRLKESNYRREKNVKQKGVWGLREALAMAFASYQGMKWQHNNSTGLVVFFFSFTLFWWYLLLCTYFWRFFFFNFIITRVSLHNRCCSITMCGIIDGVVALSQCVQMSTPLCAGSFVLF